MRDAPTSFHPRRSSKKDSPPEKRCIQDRCSFDCQDKRDRSSFGRLQLSQSISDRQQRNSENERQLLFPPLKHNLERSLFGPNCTTEDEDIGDVLIKKNYKGGDAVTAHKRFIDNGRESEQADCSENVNVALGEKGKFKWIEELLFRPFFQRVRSGDHQQDSNPLPAFEGFTHNCHGNDGRPLQESVREVEVHR